MHRAGALNWGKAVKYVLNKNNNSKIIGLSATPIRFLDNNRDMINELFYGSSTTPISLSEAIVRKILPMPIYVSAMYDLDKEIEKKLRLMKSLSISLEDKRKYIEELNVYKGKWERESKIENIIKKHLPKSKKLKFIIFCENNKHLIKMKDEVNKWFNSALDNKFNIKSFVITSINKRSKENLAKFESENNDNELKLLFAISKLNEGIHIRNITGIVMLRNTKSPSIYYQQLGRCLTTDSVDENPIVFDFVDNIDNLELVNFRKNLEEAKLFNNVYRRQIGLQDEDIRLCLYEEHEEVILELKNIERKITYNWEESFESLLKFKEINGHLNVPKNDEYLRLYSWISLQRTLYKRNILNEEFISKLNSIGFIWDINIYKYKENYKKYEELIINSYEREISYYKLLNEKYYAVIYTKESLISKFEDKDILLEKEFIIRWWDKQIKDFQNNNLDDERKEIIIKEFRETSRFEENKWLISIYKIIKFYKKINECYRIDCYLNKIAPDKKRFINFVTSIYPSKKIIENTIEKNLPSSKKTRELEAYNEEYKAREFVKKLFLENSFIFDIKEYIDDINYIYFEDMINI